MILSHHLLPEFRNSFHPYQFFFLGECIFNRRTEVNFISIKITGNTTLREDHGIVADCKCFRYSNLSPQDYTITNVYCPCNCNLCGKQGIFSNIPLLASVVFTFLLQMALIYLTVCNQIFRTSPLSLGELIIGIGMLVLVFHAVEAEKWVKKHLRSRQPKPI